jgi:hypothetical protein
MIRRMRDQYSGDFGPFRNRPCSFQWLCERAAGPVFPRNRQDAAGVGVRSRVVVWIPSGYATGGAGLIVVYNGD